MDPRGSRGPVSAWGLPRERGDGPLVVSHLPGFGVAPPRTRGWTRSGRVGPEGGIGSPANAGMDLVPGSRCRKGRGLPRERGDGPVASRASRFKVPAPPRTRGWTHVRATIEPGDLGSPANAGMDPEKGKRRPGPERLPRERGDGPSRSTSRRSARSAPPRTRGWTVRIAPEGGRSEGSPANAGMDRIRGLADPIRSGLPRERGDGPIIELVTAEETKAPPRTRGWTPSPHGWGPARAGSPANAGMDLHRRFFSRWALWLPRERGDGPQSHGSIRNRRRAPPRTRGWTEALGSLYRGRRGSPANAGMDPPGLRSIAPEGGLPRERGDGPDD